MSEIQKSKENAVRELNSAELTVAMKARDIFVKHYRLPVPTFNLSPAGNFLEISQKLPSDPDKMTPAEKARLDNIHRLIRDFKTVGYMAELKITHPPELPPVKLKMQLAEPEVSLTRHTLSFRLNEEFEAALGRLDYLPLARPGSVWMEPRRFTGNPDYLSR